MQSERQRSRAPTTNQLLDQIQRGYTGDKVAASDPAAAPLGTDEEAAGTRVPAAARRMAFQVETARPDQRHIRRRDHGFVVGVLLTCVIGIAAFAIALLFWR